MEILTQLKAVTKSLVAMSCDISADNRKDITKALKITPATLSKYLNGKGNNIDTAVSIYKECKKIIARREKELAA